MFNTIGIIGLGLIGGSLGLKIKYEKLSNIVIGYDSDKSALNEALNLELIDIGVTSYKSFSICDLVIVSVPPAKTANIILELFKFVRENTIIIDVASVKESIINNVLEKLPKNVFYIPTHPIAGTENFGPKSAFKQLFDDKYFIITPLGEISFAEKKIEDFAKRLNMKVKYMDAKKHDKIFAYISHLPHVIAYSLVDLIISKYNKDKSYGFVGGGFRDFTRIAKSNEEMWSNIFMLNKENLVEAIDDYIYNLNTIKETIKEDNINELLQQLMKIRLFKEQLDG